MKVVLAMTIKKNNFDSNTYMQYLKKTNLRK